MTHSAQPAHSLTDISLARRLERTEASANAAFVEARGGDAAWVDVDGTYAMFDTPDSPITQTFGLGVFSTPSDAQLAAIESFFAARGAATYHEVSPLGDPTLLALLHARGYRAIEQSTVLHRPTALPPATRATDVTVRRVAGGELATWADTAARGWGAESPELEGFMRDFGGLMSRARGTVCFLAECDGQPAGAAMLAIHDGTALLGGASTVPAFRRRGAQGALLAARLAYAMRAGCDLAMMAAAPGSTSQCNAERQGFRVAYTRTKWMRPRAA